MRSKLPITKTKENISEQTSRIKYALSVYTSVSRHEKLVYSKVTLDSILVRSAFIF